MKYRIVNWAEFQHYKDRSPPWIKLHGSLLTSEVWVLGNDASRALAIASMLLASRNKANDGTFNGDPEYVKRVCYLNSLPDFKPLIVNGFVEMVQDASNVLAECNTEERRGEDISAPTDSTNQPPPKQHKQKIEFDGSQFVGINGELSVWKSAYPAIDVDAEILKAAAWLVANPANRKKQLGRYINGWLSRAQEKAPRVPQRSQGKDWV